MVYEIRCVYVYSIHRLPCEREVAHSPIMTLALGGLERAGWLRTYHMTSLLSQHTSCVGVTVVFEWSVLSEIPSRSILSLLIGSVQCVVLVLHFNIPLPESR